VITYSVDSRGAVVGDNAETVKHYVYRDTAVRVLQWICNPENSDGNGQLNTGITVWEQDVVDLINQIDAAARQAVRRAHSGRAS
jgi:hypothetical protein